MRERKDLEEEEQAHLDQLLTVSPEVRTVHTLLHTFLTMVRERNPQQLRLWMKEALRQPRSQGPDGGQSQQA